jgi:hypothetical protein
MGWFRANGGRVSWLAFFALACQLALTFGHVHFRNVSVISAASAVSADAGGGPAGAPFPPAQNTPNLAKDFCAVCHNISLASAMVLPVSAVVPPVSFFHGPHWSLAATEPASRDHFYFNARGPPYARPAGLNGCVAVSIASTRRSRRRHATVPAPAGTAPSVSHASANRSLR